MESKDEKTNDNLSKRNIPEQDSEKSGEFNDSSLNEANDTEFDYLETPVENFKPNISEDSRNWNSNSGVPRGDRNRIINNSPNDSIDDEDDFFDDEDEVL